MGVADVVYEVEQGVVACGQQQMTWPATDMPRFVKRDATTQRTYYAVWLSEDEWPVLEAVMRELERQAPGHGNPDWLRQVNVLGRIIRWARRTPEQVPQHVTEDEW